MQNINEEEFMKMDTEERHEMIKEALDGEMGGFDKLMKKFSKDMKVKTKKSLYTKKQETRSDIKKRRKKNKQNKKK